MRRLISILIVLCPLVGRAEETGSCQPGSPCWQGQPAIVEPATVEPPAAVARISNTVGSATSHGSGTLVEVAGRKGIVLTCGHIFREGTGHVVVILPVDRRFFANVLAVDLDADLAVLEIADPNIAPVAVAKDYPRIGDAVWSGGYGSRGQFAWNGGKVRGYMQAGGQQDKETLELTGSARSGDSGGPILNDRGELVAVLWGTNGRTVNGTYCGRVRMFLARIFRPNLVPIAPEIKPPAPPADPIVVTPPVVAPPPCTPPYDDSGLKELLAGLATKVDVIEGRVAGIKDPEPVDKEAIAGSVVGLVKPLITDLQNKTLVDLRATVKADISSALTSLPASGPAIAVGETAATSILPALFVALGWTTPPSLALLAGAWLLRRIVRKRIEGRTTSQTATAQTATATPEVVPQANVGTVEAEKQEPFRDKEYVGYQSDDKRVEAFERAFDEFVRRYPGALSSVQTIRAFAAQFLSGLSRKGAAANQ